MLVRDIMSRSVVTVDADASVARAQDLFDIHGFHHLPVLNRGKLMGVISDGDVFRTISPFVGKLAERPQDLKTLERRVHQAMSRKPVTVTPDTTVEDAVRTMVCHRVSCLPVVREDGRLVGMVTWKDLVRAFVPDIDDCLVQSPGEPPVEV